MRNSAWNFSAYVVYVLATFLSARLYIDYVGLKQYGLLVLLGSIIAPLGLLNFGLAQATVKYMAESFARGDRAAAANYLSNTLLFNLGVGALGALTLGLLAPWLTVAVFRIDAADQTLATAMLHWTAATWLTTQVAATFTAVPTALQQYRVVSQANTFFMTMSIVLGLATLMLGGDLLNVVQVRFAWSVVTVVGWAWLANRACPGLRLRPSYHRDAFRDSFRFGAWQTAASAGSIVANQADKYLLGIYISTGAVGLFNVPTVIFTTAYIGITKLADILFPAISDLHGRGDRVRMAMLVQKAAWAISLVMASVQSALYVWAPDILRLYLGTEVDPAAVQVLRISAIVSMVSAPSIVVDQFLLGVGATHWTATTAFASGAINLIGGVLLVPRFGLAGAAWSDMIAVVGSRPLLHYLIWRRELSTHTSWREFVSMLYGSAMIGIPVTLGLSAVERAVSLRLTWLTLPLSALVVALITAASCLAAGRRLPGHSAAHAVLVEACGRLKGRIGRSGKAAADAL